MPFVYNEDRKDATDRRLPLAISKKITASIGLGGYFFVKSCKQNLQQLRLVIQIETLQNSVRYH